MTSSLFPPLARPSDRVAVDMPDGRLTYRDLDEAAAQVARGLPPGRLALWAEPSIGTVVGLVAALRAGVTVVPLNPKSGPAELAHIVRDARPDAVFARPAEKLPATLGELPRITPQGAAPDRRASKPAGDDAGRPALIMYTSGTTGPPKGVVHTSEALAANLDALAEAWGWSGDDVVLHALPLFHVHGLVLGTIGPLRLGGAVRCVGRFSPVAVAEALGGTATMLFGVPTMYHRLVAAAADDDGVAAALRRPRLLVSGSAALPPDLHTRLEQIAGARLVERYGMTETLMITSTRPGDRGMAGYVGRALRDVEVRVVDDNGDDVPADDATIGDVWVKGPSVFRGYLDRPDATAAAFRDGWFVTGDLGTVSSGGTLRLVGRRSTDLIKSGGYRIGAGEIEAALLGHPAVSEAAVRGVPDADLGERIVAWIVVAPGARASDEELIDHVARELTAHKRPREIHRVDALPRNAMGKVQKQLLER